MSAAGKYKKPSSSFRVNEWFGAERRRQDLLGALSRELFELSKEAVDPFELAAHLEALGFDNERVQLEFALPSTFALARQLFHMTPRQPNLKRRPLLAMPRLGVRQLMIVAAILGTIALQQSSLLPHWLVTLWLITWSIASSYLINKTLFSLKKEDKRAVFTAVLFVGLAGIALLLTNFFSSLPPLADTATSLLWWSVTACLWLEDLFVEDKYWVSALLFSFVAILAFFKVPLLVIIFALAFFAVVFFAKEFRLVKRKHLTWMTEDFATLAVYIGYGTGLGLLLIKLIQRFSYNLFIAGALLILFLFLAEWLALGLKNTLAEDMWLTRSSEEFGRSSLGSGKVLLRFGFLSLVFLSLLALQFLSPEIGFFSSHFLLFGVCMTLALMLFGLNNVFLPSLLFVAAGVLAILNLPIIWIFIVLALALIAVLFIQLQHVEEYGFHIIA